MRQVTDELVPAGRSGDDPQHDDADQLRHVGRLGECASVPGHHVGDHCHEGRSEQRSDERHEPVGPMRPPRGVGQADGEGESGRAEVPCQMLGSAVGGAENERADALDEDDERAPGEHGPRPTAPPEARRAGIGHHRRDERRIGRRGVDPEPAVEPGHTIDEAPTSAAPVEVRIEPLLFVDGQLVVERCRRQLAGRGARVECRGIGVLHKGDGRP